MKAAQLSCRVRILRDGVAGRISDKKELVAILLVIVVGVVVCVAVVPSGSQDGPNVIPTIILTMIPHSFQHVSCQAPKVTPK